MQIKHVYNKKFESDESPGQTFIIRTIIDEHEPTIEPELEPELEIAKAIPETPARVVGHIDIKN